MQIIYSESMNIQTLLTCKLLLL